VAQIDAIVEYYLSRIPLSREELTSYLKDNIAFQLDNQMREGLELYFKLAAKHGLIDKAKEPVFI
jgi:predicted solute-binding protein